MQGCYLRLWEELCKSAPLFILENFMLVLHRIEQHTVHAQFEQSGDWQRPGVTHPTRVPRREMDSIEAGYKDSDGTQVPLDFADPTEEDAIADADFRIDLQEALKDIPPDQGQQLYEMIRDGWTQQEIADHFHITDRTVRNRINRLGEAYRRYHGGGEGHHGE
jgi:RNA polymerase sigma factor (sigma-70 family)